VSGLCPDDPIWGALPRELALAKRERKLTAKEAEAAELHQAARRREEASVETARRAEAAVAEVTDRCRTSGPTCHVPCCWAGAGYLTGNPRAAPPGRP
jgi:hypothetical protein